MGASEMMFTLRNWMRDLFNPNIQGLDRIMPKKCKKKTKRTTKTKKIKKGGY